MKNKIIISVITIVLLSLNFLLLYLFNKQSSFFINLGILAVSFIFYRLLMFLIQKLLVSFKILIYKPDNFSYYGNEKEMREELNIEYKMQQDRVFSGWLYNIIFIILMTIICKILNNEGIISSILVALLISIPSLVLAPRMNKLSGFENFKDISSNTNSQPQRSRKISAVTWDFGGYKETTYRDEDGNKVGEATSIDWGPVTDTTIKDKDGNKTTIEHWK